MGVVVLAVTLVAQGSPDRSTAPPRPVAQDGSGLAQARFAAATQITPTDPAAGLEDAPGIEVVTSRCLQCHDADLIIQQRLERGGWEREITKMVGWGASVPDSDRALLVSYLARHYGPSRIPRAAGASSAADAALLARACTTCHDLDLVSQQRLGEAGWTREIDKMLGWGAQLTPAERTQIGEYLARTYPPR